MNTVVRSVWTPVMKALESDLEGSGRVVRFIGTSEAEDRDGDVIEADGIMLENFMKNPVLLWNHDPSLGPIGKILSVTREGSLTFFDVEFAPKEVSELAEKIFKLVNSKFLNAVSVGFIPKEMEAIIDKDGFMSGIRFTKVELLELSVVAIPAHQDALAANVDGKGLLDLVDKAHKDYTGPPAVSSFVTLEQFTKTALETWKTEANEKDQEMTKEDGEILLKEFAELKAQVETLVGLKETVDLSKAAMVTLNNLLGDKLSKSGDELLQPEVSYEGVKPTPAEASEGMAKALATMLDKFKTGSAEFTPEGEK